MSLFSQLLTSIPVIATSVSSPVGIEWWIAILVIIVGLLLLDLLVIHKDAHVISTQEAAKWSAIWIGLGLAFAGFIWWQYPDHHGAIAAKEYLAGYLIEKTLSVDNLFVFVIIFAYFRVPEEYQHRVLFWGILGALVFRGIFIAIGAVLLSAFSWVAYIFGIFLVFTGAKMFKGIDHDVDPALNPVLRLVRRFIPVTETYHGQKLFTKIDGKLWATPLFAVLVVIETTDIVFAVDSIPAIFGVTQDPFLVFTSNAFALLGLRALYFLLSNAVRQFVYLGPAIALILVFVGVKLILEEAIAIHFSPWVTLGVISVVLGGAVILSIRHVRNLPPEDQPESED